MKPIQSLMFIVLVAALTYITILSYKSEHPTYVKVITAIDDSLFYPYEKMMDKKSQHRYDSTSKADSLRYTDIEALISDTAFAKMDRDIAEIENDGFLTLLSKSIIYIFNKIENLRKDTLQ